MKQFEIICKVYRFIKTTKLIIITFIISFFINSCQTDDLIADANNITFGEKLSDYKIFQGLASNLIPSSQYNVYELSTQLFTDYAEKQRLIKIPPGYKMTVQKDGLPSFPDGTVLVKTFYYFNDKRDTTKGKKIIETRLEIKAKNAWNVATYIWNEDQTDANLITSGINKTVHWVDPTGKAKIISYHVPSNRECATCHNLSDDITPIGPKLRNLNIDVIRNGTTVNQLEYFKNIGLLEPSNTSIISTLPNANNTQDSLGRRARAYLDINCAHCHNSNGYASNSGILFNYETSFENTKISANKNKIIHQMETGGMPRIGTTIIDEEGVELIKAYINSLK